MNGTDCPTLPCEEESMRDKISNWYHNHRCIIDKKHFKLWLFNKFGIAVMIQPHWNIYILLGCIVIEILFRTYEET